MPTAEQQAQTPPPASNEPASQGRTFINITPSSFPHVSTIDVAVARPRNTKLIEAIQQRIKKLLTSPFPPDTTPYRVDVKGQPDQVSRYKYNICGTVTRDDPHFTWNYSRNYYGLSANSTKILEAWQDFEQYVFKEKHNAGKDLITLGRGKRAHIVAENQLIAREKNPIPRTDNLIRWAAAEIMLQLEGYEATTPDQFTMRSDQIGGFHRVGLFYPAERGHRANAAYVAWSTMSERQAYENMKDKLNRGVIGKAEGRRLGSRMKYNLHLGEKSLDVAPPGPDLQNGKECGRRFPLNS